MSRPTSFPVSFSPDKSNVDAAPISTIEVSNLDARKRNLSYMGHTSKKLLPMLQNQQRLHLQTLMMNNKRLSLRFTFLKL
jgi:hypothetical protein